MDACGVVKMNVAILIGVSKYNTLPALPACDADASHMHCLLSATKKYDDICFLTTKTNAGQLKDSLREFFTKYQGSTSINEVFVYFSGHGVYQSDALLCCSDFDHNRPATTSISNNELDDLLRSVGPKVAVKVIDACQSGSPYIKDAGGGFEKALKTSQLSSFICMASSRQDQFSYASNEASHFTKKWIDSALDKQSGGVLYRDIQAALADAFVSNPDQSPFFVNQGSGLELFASVTDEMQRLAAERNTPPSKTVSQSSDIIDLIEAEVKKFDALHIPHEEACKTITQAHEKLTKEKIGEPIVARFYEMQVSQEGKLSSLPLVRNVAEFASEQKWSSHYFVSVTTEPYEVRNTSSLGLFLGIKNDPGFRTETRQRPASLSSTQPLPFEVAQTVFKATGHPSLKTFILYIGIVHSLTEVMVLSAVARLSQKGWDEQTPDLSKVQWKYQSYLWKEVASNPQVIWKDPLTNAQSTIKAYLEDMLPQKSEDAGQIGKVD